MALFGRRALPVRLETHVTCTEVSHNWLCWSRWAEN